MNICRITNDPITKSSSHSINPHEPFPALPSLIPKHRLPTLSSRPSRPNHLLAKHPQPPSPSASTLLPSNNLRTSASLPHEPGIAGSILRLLVSEEDFPEGETSHVLHPRSEGSDTVEAGVAVAEWDDCFGWVCVDMVKAM